MAAPDQCPRNNEGEKETHIEKQGRFSYMFSQGKAIPIPINDNWDEAATQ